MKKLVVVADDFGWTEGVNLGILKAYKEGIVTEISLMLSSPATQSAIKYLESEKVLNVGLHMALMGWKETQKFLTRDEYKNIFKNKNGNDIERMVKDEITLFEKSTGHKPTHIAPQYGIHGNLKLLDVLIKYCLENGIPVRIPKTALMGGAEARENYAAEAMLRRSGVKMTNYLFGHVLGSNLDEIRELFLEELASVKEGETAEILLHPGYFDEEILKYTSLGYERARDLSLSCETVFKEKIEKLGITFVSYSKLF